MFTRIAPAAVAVATCIWSVGANAAVVYLDQFQIKKNGGTFFTDGFADGNAPPSAPNFPNGQPASYGVFGTFVAGSEAGGLLRLNSADGGLTQNANGQDRLTLRAALNTNTDSSDLGHWAQDRRHTRSDGALQSQFADRTVDQRLRNSFLRSNCCRSESGGRVGCQVQSGNGQGRGAIHTAGLRHQSIIERGLADFAPPNGADQILLQLTRPDTSNTNFFASYSYLQGGNVRRWRSHSKHR